MLDFDHPDAIDVPMFVNVGVEIPKHSYPAHSDKCLADLKAFRQSNIPVYSFAEHQRLAETKYLYGATVIIGRSSS